MKTFTHSKINFFMVKAKQRPKINFFYEISESFLSIRINKNLKVIFFDSSNQISRCFPENLKNIPTISRVFLENFKNIPTISL